MNGPPFGPETVPGLGPVPSPQSMVAVKFPWLAVGVPSTKVATAPLKGEPEVCDDGIAGTADRTHPTDRAYAGFGHPEFSVSANRHIVAEGTRRDQGTVLTTPAVVMRPTLFG